MHKFEELNHQFGSCYYVFMYGTISLPVVFSWLLLYKMRGNFNPAPHYFAPSAYDRGVGKIRWRCREGESRRAGLCYTNCKDGYFELVTRCIMCCEQCHRACQRGQEPGTCSWPGYCYYVELARETLFNQNKHALSLGFTPPSSTPQISTPKKIERVKIKFNN